MKMKRRAFIKSLSKWVIAGTAAILVSNSLAMSATYKSNSIQSKRKKDPCQILKEIHKEVSELGSRKNEIFIKREFHFDLDKNATNSEEHVLVLIYEIGDMEKMVIQVTYFEPSGHLNTIKYAKDIRMVSCSKKKDKLEIEKCDYGDKEMKTVLPDILKGIINEKKLFKLIKTDK